MNHLSEDQLVQITEAPNSSALANERSHLLKCSDCRLKVSKYQSTLETLSQLQPELANESEANIDAMTLSNYFAGQLSAHEHSYVRSQLKENNQDQKAALHFLTHQAVMNRNIPEITADEKTVESDASVGWLETVSRWLTQWQAPVWQTATATFAVVMVVTVLVVNPNSSLELVQFQNDEGLFWQSPQPGMGFFQWANADRQDYEGVQIQQQKGLLNFSWHPIEGVSQYRFNVRTASMVNTAVISQMVVDGLSVTLPINEFKTDQHYQWTLSGLSESGREFHAQGGFVLATSGER